MSVAQSPLGGRLSLEGLFKRLGPGVITGAADDDPSGIATYSQAGAQTGFGLLWTVVLTWPLMVAVQSVSARIGRVTGSGLAGNMARAFPRRVVTVPGPAAVRRQHHQSRRRPRRHGGGRATDDRRRRCPPLYGRLCALLAAGGRVHSLPPLCRLPEMADLLAVRLCRRGVHGEDRLARGDAGRAAAEVRALRRLRSPWSSRYSAPPSAPTSSSGSARRRSKTREPITRPVR